MKQDSIPELQALSEDERFKVQKAITLSAFGDPRVWGAYAAQIAGFVVIFFVLFPNLQPRLVLILGYVLTTMVVVRGMHRKVLREHAIALLAKNAEA